jgi:TRAP-type C4-dicarboxylate transport system permease small subunit
MLRKILHRIYRIMMIGACIAMVMAFLSIMLGVVVREASWDIQGLDAYAGYSIAAALFLALPATFKKGEHIRVTLVTNRLGTSLQKMFEHICLGVGVALTLYIAFFALRLVWVSKITHDVSQGADATPLWIPQLFMAVGCIGFALSLAEAWWSHYCETCFFDDNDGAAVRVE